MLSAYDEINLEELRHWLKSLATEMGLDCELITDRLVAKIIVMVDAYYDFGIFLSMPDEADPDLLRSTMDGMQKDVDDFLRRLLSRLAKHRLQVVRPGALIFDG